MNHIKTFYVDGVHLPWSNFYIAPFEAPHFNPAFNNLAPTVWWDSTEHYYQAAKAQTRNDAERIRLCGGPGASKRMGRKIEMRDDWEAIKIPVMREALKYKFEPFSDLADELLATGNAYLTEGNMWNDTFWGVCKGEGQNWLGWCLMAQRDMLRCWMDGQGALL